MSSSVDQTTTMTVSQLISAASELSVEQQLALNKALCELIKSKRLLSATIASSAFEIGDVVRFNAKSKGMNYAMGLRAKEFNTPANLHYGHVVECT